MKLTNANLAAQFYELHNITMDHLEQPNDRYRAATYRFVGDTIRTYSKPVWENTSELLLIKGIGPSSIQKIEDAARAKDHLIPKLKELRIKFGNVQYKMHSAYCVLNLNKATDVVLRPISDGFRLIAKVPKDMVQRCKTMMGGVCVKGDKADEWFRDDIKFTLQLKEC